MAVSVSRTTTKRLGALLLASSLAACGGGGGGGGGGTANQPPLVDAGVEVAARELTAVALMATASDPDGDNITYAWTQTNGPALDLGAVDGAALEFMLPDVAENTPYELTVTVSDGKASVSDTVTVTATINGVPVVTVGEAVDEREGATVSVTGSALDPDGNTITGYAWTQTGGMPDLGLGTVTTATLELELPDVDNDTVFEFELAASDGVDTGTATLAITALANRAPEITVTAPGTVNELTAVEMSVEATDADGDGLEYEWELLSALPIALSSETASETGFTAPVIDTNAVAAEFRVTVTDDAAYPEATAQTVTVSIAQEALIFFMQDSADGPKLYQGYTDGTRREIFASDAPSELNSYLVSPTRQHVAIFMYDTVGGETDIRIVDLQTLVDVSASPAGSEPLLSPDAEWSPDGSMLAIKGTFTDVDVDELAVVNADGSNARIVATPIGADRRLNSGAAPSWAEGTDGCWDTDDNCADGQHATGDVTDFAWSPDSLWIAYKMHGAVDATAAVAQELHTFNLDTGERSVVSNLFRDDDGDGSWDSDWNDDNVPDGEVDDFQWKQRGDGLWIAYRSAEIGTPNGLLQNNILISDALGNSTQKLVELLAGTLGGTPFVETAADWEWSPDGTYIAFEQHVLETGADTIESLRSIRFEPGTVPFTSNDLSKSSLAYTLPDGSVDSAGNSAEIGDFAWAPNSDLVAFTADIRRNDVTELHVARPESATGERPTVVGDLFRDAYDCTGNLDGTLGWSGAFYDEGADGRWDTDGYCNKEGDDTSPDNGTPDGLVAGDFTWSRDGGSLYFSGMLRMQNLIERYRWDVGAATFEVLSHNNRDERNNDTGVAIPDGVADTAIGHLGDTEDPEYGISRTNAGGYTDVAEGSGTPPSLLYTADERRDNEYELWMTRASGEPLLISDLYYDGDGDGVPDSDSSDPRDGVPNGSANYATSLGGSRILYFSSERNAFGDYELLYVDAADPAGTRRLLSVPADGTTNDFSSVVVAFPDGNQKYVVD